MSLARRNFYKKLQAQGRLPWSSVPKQVLEDHFWQRLTTREVPIVELRRSGGGQVVQVVAPCQYKQLVERIYPGGDRCWKPGQLDPVESSLYLRNSHLATRKSARIVFLRAEAVVQFNGQAVDLTYPSQAYGFFGGQLQGLTAERLCLVEHLDCFFNFERLLADHVLLFSYGKPGKRLFEALQAQDICFAPDYDLEGLERYLACKACHPHTRLYMPEEYQDFFQHYSRSLEGKQPISKYKRVQASQEEVVVKIRDQVIKTGKFLEQQVLFKPDAL